MAEKDPATALRRDGVLIVEQGGRGGIADYCGLLSAALAGLGIPVTIATARDHLFPAIPGVQVVGVFAYVRGHSAAARLVRRAGLGPVANGLRFLAVLPRLLALSRRHAVTHMQSWEAPSLGLIATLLLRASGATLVWTAHNTFERHSWLLDRARILPVLAKETIVHTEADRDRVSRPPTVISHGHYGAVAAAAPKVEATRARTELGLPADALVVLSFGVLRPDKGLGDVLAAAVDAPPWRVLIAGEDHGGLASAAQWLASPRLDGRVTVLEGFQPIEAVARVFAAADLVVLPYRRASQSGVLYLSYGFGRMVAAYPVGGLPEAVVPGVTGWICDEASPRALTRVLEEAGALGRPELHRLGAATREWAEQRYDWGRIARDTAAVYERALSGRRITTGPGGTGDGASGSPRPEEAQRLRR
jgi:D-inositol-3-phosphate glycosyltransferase